MHWAKLRVVGVRLFALAMALSCGKVAGEGPAGGASAGGTEQGSTGGAGNASGGRRASTGGSYDDDNDDGPWLPPMGDGWYAPSCSSVSASLSPPCSDHDVVGCIDGDVELRFQLRGLTHTTLHLVLLSPVELDSGKGGEGGTQSWAEPYTLSVRAFPWDAARIQGSSFSPLESPTKLSGSFPWSLVTSNSAFFVPVAGADGSSASVYWGKFAVMAGTEMVEERRAIVDPNVECIFE
jgi:hypothetical protein